MSMREFRKRIKDQPRQDLDTYYRVNGAIYIRKVTYMEQSAKILQDQEYAYIMERSHSLDIDDEQDFRMAEFFIKDIDRKNV